MALRTIRTEGDPVLEKVCRPIDKVTFRIRQLADDMIDTMYEANGVGLAAPQVGILKRMVVIETGEVDTPDEEIQEEAENDGTGQDLLDDGSGAAEPRPGIDVPMILINPVIIASDGEQTGDEGCLSIPGMAGKVTRPMHVVVRANDLDMNEVTYEAEGLLARAICHELDHLDGILYRARAEGELHEVHYEEET